MQNFYNLMYNTDFYKVSHKAQYPENVTKVHSNLVARGANYNENISKDKFWWFGLKLYIEKLKEFERHLFVVGPIGIRNELDKYKQFLDIRLGGDNDVEHWLSLWTFVQATRKLPLVIHGQPERTLQNFQTPLVSVENTNDNFAWFTSFIETSMLSNVWGVTTAANRAWHIRQTIESYMEGYTADEMAAVDFMGHDFSYRGLLGDEAAMQVGCGHLSVFKGSDTIPAIKAMEDIYGEITGFSVPATEHSVMCAGGQAAEFDTYNRILDTYPSGIVSIVSDTWDYFGVLTDTIPKLKDKIMARDGKVVIRPDSGNPVDIVCGVEIIDYTEEYYGCNGDLVDILYEITDDLCGRDVWSEVNGTACFTLRGVTYGVEMNREFDMWGDYMYEPGEPWVIDKLTPEQKGTLELLDETFGHTLDSAGLKVLDSHIGVIYGDGMNQDRIKEMLERMVDKGYSPLNIVFGIGGFTYQHMTRDELGFAFKATAVEIDGKWVSIQKDPKTDPGKKSLTGRQDTTNMELIFGG